MSKHPNIVFILSDDQAPFSLGCLHHSELQTPALDSLAEEGVLFSHCFCASPVCSPARASILTGRAPSAHGVHDWLRAGNISPKSYALSAKEKARYDYRIEHQAIDYLQDLPTYTQILSENGYTCALAGKWHLGNSAVPQCGYTKWFTLAKGGCRDYMDPDVIENGEITFPKRYITDIITEKAISFIEELSSAQTPFYINVNYTAPHSPWNEKSHKPEYLALYRKCDYDHYYPLLPDHPWATKSSRNFNRPENRFNVFRGYEAALTAMDEGIGEIIAALKRLGIYEDTVLIFTSDNGFQLGQHGLIGKGNASYPLNVYEEAVTVPFLASFPKRFSSGLRSDSLISHYDIFPTILELAGIPCPKDALRPGKSFVSLLEGKQEERSAVVFDEYGATRMIRDRRYKYVHRFPDGPHELYDLEHDPCESQNLYGAADYAEIMQALRSRLFEWFEKYTLPERDGRLQPANGKGQLCFYADGKRETFYRAMPEFIRQFSRILPPRHKPWKKQK